MTATPARLLRACVAHLIEHVPTERERAQMQYIEAAGAHLFVHRPPFTLSVAHFAEFIGVTSNALRRFYCDLEHLLGEILRNHMAALIAELNKIPENAPNRPAQCRAAYSRLIRGPDGALTDAHHLLARHRYALPPDEFEPTEKLRATLNALLGAGEIGVMAATLLDGGTASLARIETMLATLADHREPPEPAAIAPPQAANQNRPAKPAPAPASPTPAKPDPEAVRPPGTLLH
jgi:hypothetical protein